MNDQTNREKSPDISGILGKVARGARRDIDVGQLSDLDRAQVREFLLHWQSVPVDGRRFLVREMVRVANDNLEMNFRRLLHLAVKDEDPEVRALTIQGLWEDDSHFWLDQLCIIAERNDEPAVQEAVAGALSTFGYQAAVDELDTQRIQRLKHALVRLLDPEHGWMTRRRALEALAYLPDDPQVIREISDAACSDNDQVRAGALTAMGRNLDARWFPIVLEEMRNEDPDVRCEAARAAGQFEDQVAVPVLIELTEDEDEEIQRVAIKSLGAIGGRDAIEMLKDLKDRGPRELRKIAENALTEAEFITHPIEVGREG